MHQEGEFRESNYLPPTAPHQFGPQASSSDHGGPAFRMARPPPPGFPNMPYPVRYPPSYRSSAPQQFQCFPRPSGVDAQIPHAQAHVHGTNPIASGGPPQPEVMPNVVAIDIDTPPPGTSIGVGGEMGISTESPEEGTAVNPQENKDKLQSTHVKPDPIISHVADQASDQHMPGHISTDQALHVYHIPDQASPGTPDQASPGTPDQASPHTPDQASPGTPDQASPHTPDQASPGTPDQASPHTPDQASPGTPDQASPGTPDQASPGTPDQASPHTPDQASPHTPDQLSPHMPDQASPCMPGQSLSDQASSGQTPDKASSDQASSGQAPDKDSSDNRSSDQASDKASSDQASSDQAPDKDSSDQPSSDQTPNKASSSKVKKYFFNFFIYFVHTQTKGDLSAINESDAKSNDSLENDASRKRPNCDQTPPSKQPKLQGSNLQNPSLVPSDDSVRSLQSVQDRNTGDTSFVKSPVKSFDDSEQHPESAPDQWVSFWL